MAATQTRTRERSSAAKANHQLDDLSSEQIEQLMELPDMVQEMRQAMEEMTKMVSDIDKGTKPAKVKAAAKEAIEEEAEETVELARTRIKNGFVRTAWTIRAALPETWREAFMFGEGGLAGATLAQRTNILDWLNRS